MGVAWPGMHQKGRDLRGGQRRLDRRLEEVAKAVGGGYCRLQAPLTRALGVRETVAGHALGALERGGGGTSATFPMHPCPIASQTPATSAWRLTHTL